MSPASLPSFPESPSTQCFRDSKLLFFVSWVFLHPWVSFRQCIAKFQCSTQMLPFPGSQPGFSSEIPQPLSTSLILGVSESTAWSTILRVFNWKVVPASRCESSGEWSGQGGKANTGQIAELATIPRLKELVLGCLPGGMKGGPAGTNYFLFQVGHVCPERIPSVTSSCDVRGRQGSRWEACVTPSHLVPSSYTCGSLCRQSAQSLCKAGHSEFAGMTELPRCLEVAPERCPVHNPSFSLPARTVFMYILFYLIWWVFEDRYCILSPIFSMGPYT